ncbi:hypothetical protein D5086_019186 [Populus alba]|uniref:Uncharacterized protein n=1 Tax=Populus alba TaxID=43335 RepID=A0ACC4BH56_POPAL
MSSPYLFFNIIVTAFTRALLLLSSVHSRALHESVVFSPGTVPEVQDTVVATLFIEPFRLGIHGFGSGP